MEPKFLCLVFVFFFTHNVIAQSGKNVSSSSSTIQPSKQQITDSREDIIIDEDDNPDNHDIHELGPNDMMLLDQEGSGMGASSKGIGTEDMESSGSGYGPDDEDAQNKHKNSKSNIDDEEDEDDDESEDNEDNEEFDEEKIYKSNNPTITTSTTSTTTTTTEHYEEEHEIPDLHKTNIIEDNVNVAPPSIPDVPQISTTTLPPPPSNTIDEHSSNGVYISPNSHPERTSSFFAQPGILAAVIGGAVVGLLCAILVVMFIVYRMRKKDEGSYPLEETKRSPATNPYLKSTHREFYA